MDHSKIHDSTREKAWRTVNTWAIKGPFLLIALLLGYFDHALHWGRAPLAAGLAIVLPIIGFRDFWNERNFWITASLLAVAQVPLVMALGPLMEKLGFPFMFTFGICDGVLIACAISWVCSEHTRNDRS
jgi:hypothetical protein